MNYQSVNALRWDGQGWWCAGLDGAGVVGLAQHFGISFSSHPVLSLCGGGGAARSVASTWLDAGGQVHVAKSRRTLPDELLARCTGSAKDAVFGVNFDPEIAAAQAPLLLNAAYASFEGDVESMLNAMQPPHLNGRWMLVAQHLSCWAPFGHLTSHTFCPRSTFSLRNSFTQRPCFIRMHDGTRLIFVRRKQISEGRT